MLFLLTYDERDSYSDDDGAFYGDPRRCPVHGGATSSPDGLHDGLCGGCEAAIDAADEADLEAATDTDAPAALGTLPDDDDDLPF